MIDTHCHIDDPEYINDLDTVIARQREAGVEVIVVPGVNGDSVDSVLSVCRRYPGYLLPALGLHPEDVRTDYKDVLARIREAIVAFGTGPDAICAVGEVGLDYHFSTEFRTEQQDALLVQLGWAAEWGIPVIIHSRDAAEDTLRIIRDFNRSLISAGRPPLRGVMHCFSGSYEVAMEYVRMGWYLGIGGVITFRNCRLGETLVPADGRPPIPLERLVLETDAPYMAPVPYRGKPNESRFMVYVVRKLAEVYKIPKNDVILATNRASKSLFCIK